MRIFVFPNHQLVRVDAMAYFLLVLTVLFWSGNFVLGRGVHDLIPPVALSFWRWTIALVIILPFTAQKVINSLPAIKKNWKFFLGLSIPSVTCFNTFIYLALQTSTAINTVLINSMMPIFIVLISWVTFRDRLTLVQTIGVLISLLGLTWLITKGDPRILRSIQFSRGDLWTLAAGISWALYSVLLRKRPQNIKPDVFLTCLISFGLVLIIPIYLWELQTGANVALSWPVVGSIVYVAVFPSVVAYLFWNRAVGIVGANKAGIFIHLMPVFGTILSIIFLGERLLGYHIPGIALIFIGIVLTTADQLKIAFLWRKHM